MHKIATLEVLIAILFVKTLDREKLMNVVDALSAFNVLFFFNVSPFNFC